MNKYIFILVIIPALMVFSCRKDDICTEGGTPKVGISFYDNSSSIDTLKVVNDLTVIALPIEDTIVDNQSPNHIDLALNTDADSSQFVFIKDNNPDTLNFSYTRENIFVSKSCGFKTIFHQLNVDLQPDSDNWIKRIEINNHDITTDTTHVKIYH